MRGFLAGQQSDLEADTGFADGDEHMGARRVAIDRAFGEPLAQIADIFGIEIQPALMLAVAEPLNPQAASREAVRTVGADHEIHFEAANLLGLVGRAFPRPFPGMG